jgi:hypothetical protein
MPLVATPNTTGPSGFNVDRLVWFDDRCRSREARMARAGGSQSGGYLYDVVWDTGNGSRTSRGTGANGWNGWGYVVLHYANTAVTTQGQAPATTNLILSGRHHAVLRYTWRLNAGGPVDATVHWLFMTGRSEPLYAITLDSTPAGANTVRADSRAPYGDVAFEGMRTDIGGISWGDTHQFVTTCPGPVTMNCAWTYNTPNTIPFVRMWSQTIDGEMGAVQTTTVTDQASGGDYGGGILDSECRGKTSATKGMNCSAAPRVMPQEWMWPFQLNQYELDAATNSHRLAWGLTYGAVGQRSYQHFGQMLSGFPYQSYSVLMVLGLRSSNATLQQVAAVERLTRGQLTASVGTVVTQAPGGVGRTDMKTLARPGYNPMYAAYEARANPSGAVTVTLTPAGGAIATPLFRFFDRPAAPTTVRINGTVARPDIDVFITQDGTTTWLTVNGAVSTPVTLSVE